MSNLFKSSILFLTLILGVSTLKGTHLSFERDKEKPLTISEVEAFQKHFDQKMKSMSSMTSSFSQTKGFDFSNKTLISKGKLYYKSPKNIRWEYTAPQPYILLINGDKIAAGEPNSLKNSELSKNARFGNLTTLIESMTQGSKLFDSSTSNIQYFKKGIFFVIHIQPKDKSAKRFIKNIEIQIDSKDFLIKRMQITQANLDFLVLEFNEIQLDNNLPGDLFKMP